MTATDSAALMLKLEIGLPILKLNYSVTVQDKWPF